MVSSAKAHLVPTAKADEEPSAAEALSLPSAATDLRAEVVRWLDDHEEEVRGALARRGAARVTFEANDAFAREGFDVSTL